MASSGRCGAKGLSHLGPPTAPNSTEWLRCARSSAALGSGRTHLVYCDAPNKLRLQVERRVRELLHPPEDLNALGDDLCADAVAGKERDVELHGCYQPFSG